MGLPAQRLGPALTPGFATTPAVFSRVFRGFSLFGFSIIRRGDPLQALVNSSLCMVLALIANVFLNPFEISRAEAHHAIPALPFEQFPAIAEFAIHLMRGSALELADELGNMNGRCDAQADMHMRFEAADFMDIHARRVDAFAANRMQHDRFDFGSQQGHALFRVRGGREQRGRILGRVYSL
jgi:hypothetical protein